MSGNGTGSVYKYEKTVYEHGKGDDDGTKVKKIVKRWKIRYRYRDESGKLKHGRASGFMTKTEAQNYLNRLTLDIRDDNYVHKSNMTLNELADNWFRYYKTLRVRENTLDWHKYNLKHIRERFGNRQAQSIKADEIMLFYSDMMDDKVSITYVININRTFKQIMKYATSPKRKYLKFNPCDDEDIKTMLKNSKNNIKNDFEPVAIQQTDIIKLIEHTKGQTISLAIALGGLMGLRSGEIRGLRWDDIDFKNNKLHVRKQLLRRSIENHTVENLKTPASEDILDLSSYVISLLENEKQKQHEASKTYGSDKFDTNFVCAHTTNRHYIGKPFAHNYYNENLSKTLKELGMNNMRFHDLRYSFGSNLLYQNVAIQSVSKLMRHSNPQITLEVYAKVIENLHKESTAQIEEKLNLDIEMIRSQMNN